MFKKSGGITTCSTPALFLFKKIVSYQVVEFSKSEAAGRSSALDAEVDDESGPTPFTPLSSLTLLFFLVSFQCPLNSGHSSPLFTSVSFLGPSAR